jgi:hypothetical protein
MTYTLGYTTFQYENDSHLAESVLFLAEVDYLTMETAAPVVEFCSPLQEAAIPAQGVLTPQQEIVNFLR